MLGERKGESVRILITGGTGFVGSHLIDYILKEHPEHKIYVLKRWLDPLDNLKHIPEGKIHFKEGDLEDIVSLEQILFNEVYPDWVFHLAAQSYVPYSYKAPISTMFTNAIGTVNLLEALRIVSNIDATVYPRFLCVSSPEVMGQMEDKNKPWTEETPMRPVSPYALGKAAQDMAAYVYFKSYGIPVIITRGFAHEGPRRPNAFAVSNYAWQVARIEKGKQAPIILTGNLDSERTYCDVRDMARAYWLAMEQGVPGETYLIPGKEVWTVRQVLDYLLDIAGLADKVQEKPDPALLRPADVTAQRADGGKFRGLTGWYPQIPFTKTLEDLLQYWRERV